MVKYLVLTFETMGYNICINSIPTDAINASNNTRRNVKKSGLLTDSKPDIMLTLATKTSLTSLIKEANSESYNVVVIYFVHGYTNDITEFLLMNALFNIRHKIRVRRLEANVASGYLTIAKMAVAFSRPSVSRTHSANSNISNNKLKW